MLLLASSRAKSMRNVKKRCWKMIIDYMKLIVFFLYTVDLRLHHPYCVWFLEKDGHRFPMSLRKP